MTFSLSTIEQQLAEKNNNNNNKYSDNAQQKAQSNQNRAMKKFIKYLHWHWELHGMNERKRTTESNEKEIGEDKYEIEEN